MTKQQLEKELAHKTEELNQIKEILAIFVDKVYYDVDYITPDDLESKLRDNEIEKYRKIVESVSKLDMLLHVTWITEIEQLCRDLGWTEFAGYSPLHNIKLFIKSLARENFTLKQTMEGGKQRDGSSRTNNLGSSNPTTNK